MKPKDVPPYGVMWKDFEEFAQKLTEMPADWNQPPAHYGAWITTMINRVAAAFWPKYVQGTGWVGNSSHIVAMTSTEIGLIMAFQAAWFDKPAVAGAVISHGELFRAEDEGKFHKTLIVYCPELAPFERELEKLAASIPDSKIGVTDLQLKQPFQRPRPYQMARLMNLPFNHYFARWAITPSLVSAHALESAAFVASAHAWLKVRAPALAKTLRPRMQECAMDIGDHRIMAGVHYPMDGMASYAVLLDSAKYLFTDKEVPKFIAQAVSQHSRSFQVVKGVIEGDPAIAAPFQAGWKMLNDAIASA